MNLEARTPFDSAKDAPPLVIVDDEATVTLRLRPDIGCVQCALSDDTHEAFTMLEAALGASLPREAGAVSVGSGLRALWLSPRSWLLLLDDSTDIDATARLQRELANRPAHAAAFSDYLCWFEMSGSRACDVLREGTFVDDTPPVLPRAKRTRLAEANVVLVQQSPDSWLIGVERSRARYLANWLIGRVRAKAHFPSTQER